MAINTVNVNQEQQRYQKPSIGKTIAGVGAGFMSRNILINLGHSQVSKVCFKKITEAGDEIGETGAEKFRTIIQEILDKTGLQM